MSDLKNLEQKMMVLTVRNGEYLTVIKEPDLEPLANELVENLFIKLF